MHKRHGFTIVELLVVIVTVAILSSVTVVAYTGIQRRATNTQVSAALKQWKTIFGMYKAQTGSHPATPPQAWVGDDASGSITCLGKAATKYCHLQILSGNEMSGPGNMNGVPYTTLQASYNQLFTDLGINVPSESAHSTIKLTSSFYSEGRNVRGIQYGYNFTGGAPYRGVYLYYALNGTTCLTGDEKVTVIFGYPEGSGQYTASANLVPTGDTVSCRSKLGDEL